MINKKLAECLSNPILLDQRTRKPIRPQLCTTDTLMTRAVGAMRYYKGKPHRRRSVPLEDNRGRGRPESASGFLDCLNYALEHRLGLALYPSNFGLLCIDVDSPTADAFAQENPSFLYRTRSRSAFGLGKARAGTGHVWVRPPKSLQYLKTYGTSKLSVLPRHTIDLRYTQFMFVPFLEWHEGGFLQWLAEWTQTSSPRHFPPFPYTVLARTCTTGRNAAYSDLLWSMLLDMDRSSDVPVTFESSWQAVADASGYETKRPGWMQDMTQRSIRKLHSAPETSTDSAGRTILAMDYSGICAAAKQLELSLRYNVLTKSAEILHDQTWKAVDDSVAFLNECFSASFSLPRKGSPPWSIRAALPRVLGDLTDYAENNAPRHHVLEEFFQDVASVDPMDKDTCLLMLTMDGDPTVPAAHYVAVERWLLRVLWSRLQRAMYPGTVPSRMTHADLMPVLLGPGASGKSRYCQSLAMGDLRSSGDGALHATADFSVDRKRFGEVATTSIVLEIAEISELLNGSTKRAVDARMNFKEYISVDKFNYRAAYARTASGHYVSGVLVATANEKLTNKRMVSDEAVRRRMIYLPLRHSKKKVGPNFEHWDSVWASHVGQAFSRAALDHQDVLDGNLPTNLDPSVRKALSSPPEAFDTRSMDFDDLE